MPKVTVSIQGIDKELIPQLEYALTFASEDILGAQVVAQDSVVEAEVKTESACESAAQKIQELVKRYSQTEFGLPHNVHFSQARALQNVDAWQGLLQLKLATPVGKGQVILRGAAAQLMSLIDSKVENEFARHFDAELEVYPSTIESRTLDRCAHFTSFPEHIDFVAHLKQDLDVLNGFSGECREKGWSSDLHNGRMADSHLAISPSCCYHCYEGMEGWRLEAPGRCVTATLACHRYEGANHRTLSRLRAFTMREVVFVGQPRYVIEARARGEELIIQWAKDWELDCSFETANDMFFTQDFSVKASFQRLQQAKKELRLRIPAEDQHLSVFSSNFHAVTFGKTFNIKVGERPATTGCLAWGYERWVYAVFSQFGFDVRQWPSRLRAEFESHRARPSL